MAYSDNFAADIITLVDGLEDAELLDFNNLLFEETFQYSDLAMEHEVITGVRNGSHLPILDDDADPETFPFTDETSCTPPECDITPEYSSYTWAVKLIECRVPICLRTFSEGFLKFWNAWRQTQEGEPDLSQAYIAYMVKRFSKNHQLALWRAAYFADSSASSDYLNGYDGIFVQAEANPDQVVTITENSNGSGSGSDCLYADQAITGAAVYEYLEQMYELGMAGAWFDDTMVEYQITRSMAYELVKWLNRQEKKAPTNCECIDPKTGEMRRTYRFDGLMFNGIPIKVRHEWDDIIKGVTELNGGGTTTCRVQPHRAILAKKSNLLIGTSETDALNSFDIYYWKKEKKVYIEGSSYVGSGIPKIGEYVVAL